MPEIDRRSDPSTLQRLAATVLLFAAAAGPAPALSGAPAPAAAGTRIEPKAEPKAEVRDARPAARSEGRPLTLAATGARDPMDVLREKLAAKLGAAKPSDGRSANVLRVVSKAEAGSVDAAPAKVRERRIAAAAHAERTAVASGIVRPVHWGYDGDGGPESWGRLQPEYAACANGTRQSPIDIRGGLSLDLDPIGFNYRPTGFAVLDNGHTVQVNVGADNSIDVMGRRYELVQFHFHRPAEERINGRRFDMGLHLVHKDAEGRLAVVAVLLERGAPQPQVQAVWNNLPLEKGDELVARAPLDLNELLPKDRRYITYMGSLTTPPCSEGVLWLVMQQPLTLSMEQIAIFARLYPMNARPLQAASGRLIKQSN